MKLNKMVSEELLCCDFCCGTLEEKLGYDIIKIYSHIDCGYIQFTICSDCQSLLSKILKHNNERARLIFADAPNFKSENFRIKSTLKAGDNEN